MTNNAISEGEEGVVHHIQTDNDAEGTIILSEKHHNRDDRDTMTNIEVLDN